LRQQDLEGVPRFRFAFASEFFEKIAQIPRKRLPKWVGELYLELHRGTYTTQAYMKKLNRKTELALRDIEILSVMLNQDITKQLEPIWKDTLLHQFHDILPGSSINRVYKEAHQVLEKNLSKLESMQEKLLERNCQGDECSPDIHYFMIYNTLNWQRQEVVTLPIGEGQAINSEGNQIPCEIVDGNMLCKVTLPPTGYETIRVDTLPKRASCIPIQVSMEGNTLENELIRVQFAEDGTISSIFDKEMGYEMLSGKANLLQLWEDLPNNWEAWDINHFYHETTPEQAMLESRKVYIQTDFYVCVEQQFKIGKSTITQYISLEENSKLIKIENHVDWKEERKMLRVCADTNLLASDASYEIQYGTLKRSTSLNTSWEQAKFEVPAHRFADLSQADRGLALLNDSKYGYAIHGSTMELNLLRSPNSPDPEADRGKHQFVFAYYPHAGTLESSDVLQMAHNLNSMPIVQKVTKPFEKLRFSYFELSNPSIKMETLKHAEDGNGIIIRLYETRGGNAATDFTPNMKWKEMIETDLLENRISKVSDSKRTVTLNFKPFEIRTFRLI